MKNKIEKALSKLRFPYCSTGVHLEKYVKSKLQDQGFTVLDFRGVKSRLPDFFVYNKDVHFFIECKVKHSCNTFKAALNNWESSQKEQFNFQLVLAQGAIPVYLIMQFNPCDVIVDMKSLKK